MEISLLSSAFQGGRRPHPDPLLRRLPPEERDGQASVEAGHLRRAPDRIPPPRLILGLRRRRLRRRLGRHHQPGPRRFRQGAAPRRQRRRGRRGRRREEEGADRRGMIPSSAPSAARCPRYLNVEQFNLGKAPFPTSPFPSPHCSLPPSPKWWCTVQSQRCIRNQPSNML